jgi:hypothetical protein
VQYFSTFSLSSTLHRCQKAESFTKRLADTIMFLIIIAGIDLQPDKALGVDRFGPMAFLRLLPDWIRGGDISTPLFRQSW